MSSFPQPIASFDALISAKLSPECNALCWSRTLVGDFAEVAAQLGSGEGVVPLTEEKLRALTLSAAGKAAVDFMLADLARLQALGLEPELNAIYAYPRDDSGGAVPTDVFSWHVDSATERADTWLCTYHGAPSEVLAQAHAQRRIDNPLTRAALLREFGQNTGGSDPGYSACNDANFAEWLHEQCYDLHYEALAGAQPWSLGVGNLWRLATAYPGSTVPPCIHRAPETQTGQVRLLLIA